MVKNYGLSCKNFKALRMRGMVKENSCCKTRFLIIVSGQELQRKLKFFLEALSMRGMKKENSCCKTRFLIFVSGQELRRKLKFFLKHCACVV